VILSGIFGALAVLSFLLTLWQWLAARRFPLHQRSAELRIGAKQAGSGPDAPNRSSAPLPAVTLLKPLKGADEHTEACLRSWFAQDYAGEIQILFGVAEVNDPACGIVKKLLVEFPQRDAQLIVCPERLGTSAKVSKLAQLEIRSKTGLIVISDADVKVPSDLLANLVAPLIAGIGAPVSEPGRFCPDHPQRAESETGAPPPVGLVCCFFQHANPTTLAMRWEAVAINADFWSQVLQSRSLRPLDFALGAVMATRRDRLAEIGGFRALVDYLADDYQLGQRIAQHGHRIELCPVVVECWSSPMDWGAVWRHQLRWARTIRVCQPLPYFFSLLSNATFWPLLWLAVAPALISVATGVGFLLVRILTAADLQRRLTRSSGHVRDVWLVPVKDLLQAILWALAFAGNRIEWRGERYAVRRDGTIEKAAS
jgi:ceramide glucosyltransferase